MRDSRRTDSVYLLLAISVFAQSFVVPLAHADPVIPLEILEPPERANPVRDFPVNVGMIFPEGVLKTPPGGALIDDRGRAVPFDFEVTGWWSAQKRDVKWLLLHFKASSDRKYSFVLGAEPARTQGRSLAVESGRSIGVNTGPLQARLAPGNAPVFESVSLNGRPILAAPHPGSRERRLHHPGRGDARSSHPRQHPGSADHGISYWEGPHGRAGFRGRARYGVETGGDRAVHQRDPGRLVCAGRSSGSGTIVLWEIDRK